MYSEIIHECIKKAMENSKVVEAIEKREKSNKVVRIEEIRGRILKGKDNRDITKLLVRVGFDFRLKVENLNVKEDILVNVLYELDKRTSKESYQIKDIMFVPEID